MRCGIDTSQRGGFCSEEKLQLAQSDANLARKQFKPKV